MVSTNSRLPNDRQGRLTVAWDVDDVLNDLMRVWYWWLGARTGLDLPGYDKLVANPPHEVIGMSREDYLIYLDEFRLTHAASEQHPVREVLDWFKARGDRYHHIALTATPLISAHVSAEWVMRNFGRWIRTYHFVPSPRDDDGLNEYETKGDALMRLGCVDVFVDDLPANCDQARALGIDTVLFPRPWNGNGRSISDALNELDDLLRIKEHARG